MDMKPLISSNLQAAGYDSETRQLDIQFNNGNVYSYDDVEQSVGEGIFSAASPGQYFRNFIKGRYRFVKQ